MFMEVKMNSVVHIRWNILCFKFLTYQVQLLILQPPEEESMDVSEKSMEETAESAAAGVVERPQNDLGADEEDEYGYTWGESGLLLLADLFSLLGT